MRFVSRVNLCLILAIPFRLISSCACAMYCTSDNVSCCQLRLNLVFSPNVLYTNMRFFHDYPKDGTVILWPGVASFQLLVFADILLLDELQSSFPSQQNLLLNGSSSLTVGTSTSSSMCVESKWHTGQWSSEIVVCSTGPGLWWFQMGFRSLCHTGRCVGAHFLRSTLW